MDTISAKYSALALLCKLNIPIKQDKQHKQALSVLNNSKRNYTFATAA